MQSTFSLWEVKTLQVNAKTSVPWQYHPAFNFLPGVTIVINLHKLQTVSRHMHKCYVAPEM